MKQRLSKVLAYAGVASRRAAEELIFQGRVSVNGAVVRVPQTLVDSDKDQLAVDGERVKSASQRHDYLFHKPKGYLCTSEQAAGKRSVLRFFQGIDARLFCVGRLDKETEGLILITNDGHFANRVMHPRYEVHKEYLVKTKQEITDQHLKALSEGGMVENAFVRPVSVKKVRKGTLRITVKEGRKREVRHLVAQAGLDLLELKRIRIGNLTLGQLPVGHFRPLSEEDKEAIFD